MPNFFVPSAGNSPFITSNTDIVQIDTTKRVLLGAASSDVLSAKTVSKGDVVSVSAVSNASVIRVGVGSTAFISSEITGSGSLLPITFSIGGTEVARLKLSTVGYLGINTTNPLYSFHTRGTSPYVAGFDATTSGCTVVVYSTVSPNEGRIGTLQANPFSLITNATVALYIDASQNISIGNTSPSGNRLRVNGGTVLIDGTSSTLTVTNASGSSVVTGPTLSITSSTALVSTITVTTGSQSIQLIAGNSQNCVGTYSTDPFSVYSGSGNVPGVGTPQITVFNSGNVVVAYNTDQSYKLAVNGTTKFNGNSIVVGTFNTSGVSIFQSAVKIGDNNTPSASAILELLSTSQGLLLPRMTTVQKNSISSPAEGLIVYDTTLHKVSVRTASSWETVSSS